MKKFLSGVLLVASASLLAAAADVTVRGTITDAKCGAKINPACAVSCINAGEAPILVTTAGKIYKIANPDTVKKFAGKRVAVTGALATDTLTVSAVQAGK